MALPLGGKRHFELMVERKCFVQRVQEFWDPFLS